MAKQALLKAIGDVDIRLLRVFGVVAACNGIAASEFELNIGKSTISRHVSDLEDRLGLRLCNRGPSGFSLTAEGAQVLELTRQLLIRIDEFQSGVDAIQSTLTGTLRLGLYDQSSANPNAHLDEAIAKFDVFAPDVKLEIALDTMTALEANVYTGALDLAVMPVYHRSSMLEHCELYAESMSLYCGRGHPLFGAETKGLEATLTLAEYKYAGYSFNSPNMRATNRLGLERAADVKDEEVLALLVQSGRYIGFLADQVAEGITGPARFWPLFQDETSYSVQFAATFRKRPEPDRKTATFLKCLVDAHRS